MAKALLGILALCLCSGLIGYSLAPQTVSLDKPMVPKPVRTTAERSSERKHDQCFGTLKKEVTPYFSLLYLFRDGGVACIVEDPHAERLIFDACKLGEFCVLNASLAARCRTYGPKSEAGLVPLDDCLVLQTVAAARSEIVTVKPITKDSPPSRPTEASAITKAPSSEAKPHREAKEQATKGSETTNELELRSLGRRHVNEGITRERYVLYSSLQLTNVSQRTVRIEEWWVNRRQSSPSCSKTTEMENNLLGEAAKLKQETGRDISALFGRQLRPLRPGEFITLDIPNDVCGNVFRVDVRTDRRTEFWTVQ